MDDAPEGLGPRTGVFEEFVSAIEPGLRRALVAGYGSEVGRDAATDALAWAWQNWARVSDLSNPAGYLYRVGQSAARAQLRQRKKAIPLAGVQLPALEEDRAFEPALARALAALSPRQRAAVILVHGFHYSLTDAAGVMGCTESAVRNHITRALKNLRRALGVSDG